MRQAINLTPINSSPGTIDNVKPTEQTGSAPKPVSSDYYIKSLSPEEFILYTDFQLKKYNDVAIDFAESKAASFAKEPFPTQYDPVEAIIISLFVYIFERIKLCPKSSIFRFGS